MKIFKKFIRKKKYSNFISSDKNTKLKMFTLFFNYGFKKENF